MAWLVRKADEAGGVSPPSSVTLPEPGWTEATFIDGTYFYGRASTTNCALIDADEMARIRGFGYAPVDG